LKSVGYPIEGIDFKIFNPDENGNGELTFRGRNIMMGYLKNDPATKEAIDSDGFMHSGDLGKLDN
jgi:long-chain-fatty-acid--CoA ligase ACSBG